MVGGTKGASYGATLSDAKNGTRRTFDVRSWQGLTEILEAARNVGFSDSEYAVLRDAVLQYAQSGGDGELRKEIDAAISRFNLNEPGIPAKGNEPPNVKKKHSVFKQKEPDAKPKEIHRYTEQAASSESMYAAGRPTPQFSIKEKNTLEPKVPPQNAQATASTGPKIVRAPGVQDKETTLAVPDNLPTGRLAKRHTEKREETPVSQTAPRKEHMIEKASSSPQHTEAGIQNTVPASVQTLGDHKRRIAEIKHEVNTKIGNPVTLVEIGNEIGKEYMNALLAAMKASAGGYSGSLDVAMARLEKASELVLQEPVSNADPTAKQPQVERVEVKQPIHTIPKNIKKHPVSEQHTPPEQVPKKRKHALRQMIKEKRMGKGTSSVVSSIPQRSVPPNPPHSPRQSVVAPQVHRIKPKEPEAVLPLKASVPSLRDLAQEESSPVNVLSPTPTAGSPKEEEPSKKVTPEKLETELSHAPSQPVKVGNSRVGMQTSEMATGMPNQTELSSPEVTTGLNQLLHEWGLFKGSGFLGIGPSGLEHPLYKQLSGLSMFAVIAGRWEHATPHVTQSIKDYTNAWRYEQGIMYTPGETFEHYLRRVVLRILKRQNS